jgi:hypothetical protein
MFFTQRVNMTQPPYPQLAKEFMDLWQKQMASVMGDKQFIHAMLEIIQNLQMPHADKKPTTATHTSTASDATDEQHAQLAYRLSQCERRLAAL